MVKVIYMTAPLMHRNDDKSSRTQSCWERGNLHTSLLLCVFQFTLHQTGLESVNSINDYIESLPSLILKTGGQLLIAYGFNDCNFEAC